MPTPLPNPRFADDGLRMASKKRAKSGVQLRLEYAMKKRAMGVRELERALKGGNASISKTLNRPGAKLSADRARAVAGILDVRAEWLMWDEGPMEIEQAPTTGVRKR